jgi:hypothetical protein
MNFFLRLDGSGLEEGHPNFARLQRDHPGQQAHRPEHGPLLQHQGNL